MQTSQHPSIRLTLQTSHSISCTCCTCMQDHCATVPWHSWHAPPLYTPATLHSTPTLTQYCHWLRFDSSSPPRRAAHHFCGRYPRGSISLLLRETASRAPASAKRSLDAAASVKTSARCDVSCEPSALSREPPGNVGQEHISRVSHVRVSRLSHACIAHQKRLGWLDAGELFVLV